MATDVATISDTVFFRESRWLGFGKGHEMTDSTGKKWRGAVGLKGTWQVTARIAGNTREIFHYRKVG